MGFGIMGRCIHHWDRQDTSRPLRGEARPSTTVPDGPLRNAGPIEGEGASPGCRLLLRRLPKLVVELRLTEILIEVGGIAAAGAGEVCPFRAGIRAAAAFASGWLVLDAPASLCLPAAVTGIGVRLDFRGRLCSLPGPRTLAVVVLRTGLGRGLARLAVVVLRTGPGRGLARLAVLVPRPGPRLAVLLVPRPGPSPGWASVGVDGHGATTTEKQADGEEECCGGTGTCGRRCEGHSGKYQGGSPGRTHGNLHWGMDGFTSASELCRIMVWTDVMDITKWSISGFEKTTLNQKKVETRRYSL